MWYVISNELYHHGIKGQKWGVRRYQDADGSYTAEGKERYHNTHTNISQPAKKPGKAVLKEAQKLERIGVKKDDALDVAKERVKDRRREVALMSIFGTPLLGAATYLGANWLYQKENERYIRGKKYNPLDMPFREAVARQTAREINTVGSLGLQ